MSDLMPKARELRQRAVDYRARAKFEKDAEKAARYRKIAEILDQEAAALAGLSEARLSEARLSEKDSAR